MEYYDKNKESSYHKYLDINKFCAWAVSQKLPSSGFKWVEETFQFK